MWFKKNIAVTKGEKGAGSEIFDTTSIYRKYEKDTGTCLDILINNNKRLMASQRFHEFAIRLDHRYINLKNIENIIADIPDDTKLPVSKIQLEFVNRVEAYYQQLYASLSALAMLINHTASHDFKKNMSIRSISSLLEFLSKKDIPLESEIKELTRAVEFRGKFVDHIQQHTLHDWMTYGIPFNETRHCVVIYFINKGPEVYAPCNYIFDPYHKDFNLSLNHGGFYVSPPQDNCHKAFFSMTEKILTAISSNSTK